MEAVTLLRTLKAGLTRGCMPFCVQTWSHHDKSSSKWANKCGDMESLACAEELPGLINIDYHILKKNQILSDLQIPLCLKFLAANFTNSKFWPHTYNTQEYSEAFESFVEQPAGLVLVIQVTLGKHWLTHSESKVRNYSTLLWKFCREQVHKRFRQRTQTSLDPFSVKLCAYSIHSSLCKI